MFRSLLTLSGYSYDSGCVVVEEVIPGYGASVGQLQLGDILTEIDGVEVAGKDPGLLFSLSIYTCIYIYIYIYMYIYVYIYMYVFIYI